MKRIKITACAMAALLAAGMGLGSGHITASANSAPPYWEGTTAAGALVTGEQCPIEVEHELLTLNIPSLPQISYSSQEDFENYGATVTAEYTFYNPTDMDVEMELAFPFGVRPEYAYSLDDTARYEITANGEAVERELRYTYQQYSFSVESMYSISDEKRAHEFFSPEMPVMQYSYAVEFPQGTDRGLAWFELSYNPTRTKIFCWNYRGQRTVDGNLHLYLYADTQRNATVSFIAVGEAPEIVSSAVVENHFSWQEENRDYIEGAAVHQHSVTETTFEEYVDAARPEGIGEVDFYNGFLDYIAGYLSSGYYGSCGLVGAAPENLNAQNFMRWYTYSLKIPAGGRVINSVTAPLYPTIDHKTCEYEYLLSPAQKWAAFGTLEIVINTEFEIFDSSLEFTKMESGYTLVREGLPLGELTFSIAGDYEYPNNNWVTAIIVIIAIVIVLAIVGAAAGIAVGIVFGVKRAKKKKGNK